MARDTVAQPVCLNSARDHTDILNAWDTTRASAMRRSEATRQRDFHPFRKRDAPFQEADTTEPTGLSPLPNPVDAPFQEALIPQFGWIAGVPSALSPHGSEVERLVPSDRVPASESPLDPQWPHPAIRCLRRSHQSVAVNKPESPLIAVGTQVNNPPRSCGRIPRSAASGGATSISPM